jgi:hypothetical protein
VIFLLSSQSQSQGTKPHLEILLAFLSCLFVELDAKVQPQELLSSTTNFSSLSLSPADLGALSLVQSRLAQYELTKRDDDKLVLSQVLIEAISNFLAG